MQKPPRPEPTPIVEEEDYDDGDPYACIAAGAANIKQKNPNWFYLVVQAYESRQPSQLADLLERDAASVKTALYDLWNSGRSHRSLREKGRWAAEQMARLGDSSLLEYDEAVPPTPG